MKRITSPSTVALVLLALAVALPAAAQSANGSFQFQFDNSAKSIEFNVKATGNSAKGNMTFEGVTAFASQDTDGTGEEFASGDVPMTIKVEFDCFVTSGNRASASGVVTQASIPSLVGSRGILTVEDNGEGINQAQPDRFTWGLYPTSKHQWTPSDSEVIGDSGASLSWYATDAERSDDVAVRKSGALPQPADCRAFSLGSYAVEDLLHGNGNIQVRP